MSNLADQADATAFGYGTLPAALFKRASDRIRAYVRQTITEATTTVEVAGPVVALPERPVQEVLSVKDAHGVDVPADRWRVRPGGFLEVDRYAGGVLTVEYKHGFAVVPESVKEVCCAVAARLAATPEAQAAGVTQESGGSESVSYGFDSYKAVSSLAAGEKEMLDRLFPRRPSAIGLRT